MILLTSLSERNPNNTELEMVDFSQIEIDPVKRMKGIFVELRKLSPTDPKYTELLDQGFRVMEVVCKQFFPQFVRTPFTGSVFLKAARVYSQIESPSPVIDVLAGQYVRAFESFKGIATEEEFRDPLMELADAHTRFTSAIIQERSTRNPQLFIRLKELLA
jgi:hypothetical protein